MFRTLFGVGALALALSGPAWADADAHEHPAPQPAEGHVQASAGELVVRVNGVVCSFCAHGLEKSLRKLDGIDPARHGDGVLVEVDRQLVRLALAPGQAVDFTDIAQRVRKAGYDPVRFHLRVAGEVTAAEGGFLLAGTEPPQRFWLVDAPAGAARSWPLRVEAEALAGLEAGAPVPGQVDEAP